MRNITAHTDHPIARIVISEMPQASEQGIIQFISSRGLCKLKEAEAIARDIRREPAYA